MANKLLLLSYFLFIVYYAWYNDIMLNFIEIPEL